LTGGSVGLRTGPGRWTLAAAILGSGAVFLEGSVATVALPAMGRQFALGFDGLQWVMNAYLLPLSALILLGGSLGDRYSRARLFAIGLIGFGAASALCALAMSTAWLLAARLLQGTFGALVVPNSLALLDELFAAEDRGAAIGQWAGWSSVSAALGPLLGGWLVDAVSWRWVFAIVVPFAIAAALIALRRVPDARRGGGTSHTVDYPGAALASLGLGGMTAALVSAPKEGLSPMVIATGTGGVLALLGFLLYEHRARHPLLPTHLFASRQFSGTNLVTLLVYTALGTFFFLFILMLQNGLGLNALEAGASLLPLNALMLGLSPRAGRLAARLGARIPMTVGALVAALGFVLLSRIGPESRYLSGILPGVVVFGLGLATLVAPLTSAVLGAVPDGDAGVASAVNNAAARLAGLLGTALVPLVAGLGGVGQAAGARFAAGYSRAMLLSAGLCVAGSVLTWLTVGPPAGTSSSPAHSRASRHGRARARS
jgi:EmrB/QacA subfamily drug resistance transporter